MRGGGCGRQVRTKVKLRPKEDDSKEQCQNADALGLGLHVLTKTKLRPEWLQDQVSPDIEVLVQLQGDHHREKPLYFRAR